MYCTGWNVAASAAVSTPTTRGTAASAADAPKRALAAATPQSRFFIDVILSSFAPRGLI